MNSEAPLIVEIFDLFKEYVPANRRLDIALQMLKIFEDYGTDLTDLDFNDEDNNLQQAIKDLIDVDGLDYDEEYDE